MSAAQGGAQPDSTEPTAAEIRRVFLGLMVVLALGALDQSIVATALPRIVADLGGAAHLSWVVTAYVLASTVTMPLYGKLSDQYGRKPLPSWRHGFFRSCRCAAAPMRCRVGNNWR